MMKLDLDELARLNKKRADAAAKQPTREEVVAAACIAEQLLEQPNDAEHVKSVFDNQVRQQSRNVQALILQTPNVALTICESNRWYGLHLILEKLDRDQRERILVQSGVKASLGAMREGRLNLSHIYRAAASANNREIGDTPKPHAPISHPDFLGKRQISKLAA